MSSSLNIRTFGLLAFVAVMAGCVSKPLIEPVDLPPEASLDDGIDYYSANLAEDEILNSENDQWVTDEEGNRVYLLNQISSGSATMYYVGDIQYMLAQENRNRNRASSAFDDAPTNFVHNGVPRYSQSYRGPNEAGFRSSRRGRITYLPTRRIIPSSNNNQNSQGSRQDSSPSTSNRNVRPRQPATAPPQTPRRIAPPPTTKPTRQPRPRDESRRQDR